MKHIRAANVNDALAEGFWHLKLEGVMEDSRNGPVIVAPTPVTTTYTRPQQRVLFNPIRDANPVFHLMEALWMLSGSDKAEFPVKFNASFDKYAEDDGRIHGAYGHRWRGGALTLKDQVEVVIEMLQRNKADRRAVIQMWDASLDLNEDKRDVPCNTTIYFDCRGGELNMTVCNRSNDILWGAYGANAVHMSMLQEIVAAGVEIPIGVYRQMSNNFHAYLDIPQVKDFLQAIPQKYDFYAQGFVEPMPLVGRGEHYKMFLLDCEALVDGNTRFLTKFFRDIVTPLYDMYLNRKEGVKMSRADIMKIHPGNDWMMAFADWCDRRDSQ